MPAGSLGHGEDDGTVTVRVLVADLPSLVAVIVAGPAATPVTRPVAFTVATAVLELDQVTMRPVSGLPAASFVAAASCWVAPLTTVAVAGVTVTVATGTGDVGAFRMRGLVGGR